MQNGEVFKVFGILTFVFELIMILGLLLVNRRETVIWSFPIVIRIVTFFSLTTVTAVGLIYRKKWAAIFFSFVNLSFALWLIIGSIFEVPFPLMFINFFVGFIFIVPGFLFYISNRVQSEEN